MTSLLMITGDRALAAGKHGAFYNTLEELHKHFDRIDIICPAISSLATENLQPFDNVLIHPAKRSIIFQPFWILRKGLEIYRHHKFDLVTVHEYPPFYNGLGACMLHWKIKIPYILEIFHVPGHPRSSGLKELIYKFITRLYIGFDAYKATAVRVMNNDIGSFLKKAGVPEKKIKLIPAIYIDTEIFKPMDVSKTYDLIFVGRLESNKGIDLLLEAIKLSIYNYQFPIKCLVVGDGSLRDWVQSQITNYKLPITMFGFAKDSMEIAGLLNKSRILVMPSYNEGGPRVVVEAMACGVPVLATPVGIVPDLLKKGLGGAIVGWSADDIGQKIAGLLGDSEMYKKHSAAALEIAQNFEKKQAIKNVADQLKSLLR